MDWTLPQASDTHDRGGTFDVLACIQQCTRDSLSDRALARAEQRARAAAVASGASPEEVDAAGEHARLVHTERVWRGTVEDALEQEARDARTLEFSRGIHQELSSQPGIPEDFVMGLAAELDHITASTVRARKFVVTAERAAARARAAVAAAVARRARAGRQRSAPLARHAPVARSQPRCRQRSRRTRRQLPRASSASDDGSGEPPRRFARPGQIGGAS